MPSSDEKDDEYWAVLDDVCISISKSDELYSVGRYVKVYGDYEGLMCSPEEDTEFTLVKPKSKWFKRCEDMVWEQIGHILDQIRSRHVCWKYEGRYGASSNRYGGYRNSGGDYEYHGDYGGGLGRCDWKYKN